MARLSIQKYRDMKINSAENADPYELVQMVLKAILGKLAAAKACIEQNNVPEKGRLISECITLIGSLDESLDMEQGGDISRNLSDLYNFCSGHLIASNVENDTKKIDDVYQIIGTIKEAWDEIPKQTRDEYLEKKVANR